MKLINTIVCVLLVTSMSLSAGEAMCATNTKEDVLYLKNGSVIHGEIVEQVPNKSIKLETKDGNIFVYSITDVDKITKERPRAHPRNPATKVKKPAMAWLLSFLFPGIGQYYNGDVTKGIVQEILFVGGITMVAALGYETETHLYFLPSLYSYWDPNLCGPGIGGYRYTYTQYPQLSSNTSMTMFYPIGLAIAGASYIWSMIDAPISAGVSNRTLLNGRRFEFGDDEKYAMDIQVGPLRSDMIGGRVTLLF